MPFEKFRNYIRKSKGYKPLINVDDDDDDVYETVNPKNSPPTSPPLPQQRKRYDPLPPLPSSSSSTASPIVRKKKKKIRMTSTGVRKRMAPKLPVAQPQRPSRVVSQRLHKRRHDIRLNQIPEKSFHIYDSPYNSLSPSSSLSSTYSSSSSSSSKPPFVSWKKFQ
jgi:hypothetical protein